MTKVTRGANVLGSLTIRRNAQICRGPKSQGWSTCASSVSPTKP